MKTATLCRLRMGKTLQYNAIYMECLKQFGEFWEDAFRVKTKLL